MRKIFLLLIIATAFAAHSQSLDKSFNGKGYNSFDFATGNFYYESGGQVLRKPDGSFFVLYTVNGYAVVSHYFADGDKDNAFGAGGYSQPITITEPKAALQQDGKIVVAGNVYDPATRRSDFGITRLTASGLVDKSFGAAGYRQIDFSGDDDRVSAVALQPNGKILVGGQAYDPSTGYSDFAIVRLNANGALDKSFDGDGKLTTDFAGFYDDLEGLAVMPDGKIIAGGTTYNPETFRSSMIAARYNADGSPDESFSGDGKQTTNFSGNSASANAVAVQADGKIVLAGTVGEEFATPTSFALVRYNTNGSLDAGFNGDGKATTDFGDTINVATAIAIQADGKIVVGGYAYNPKSDRNDFAIAKFNSNGTLDKGFNKDGRVRTDYDKGSDEITSIVLLPDGKLFASGTVFNQKESSIDYAVALYRADGKLEHKFGHKGFVTGYFEGGDSRINAVAVQPDGKIIVAGSAFVQKTLGDFAIARFNANGTPDKTFGNDGMVTTDFLDNYDEALSIAIQPDGKIVVAGVAFNDDTFGNEIAVARYLPDGSLDKKFAAKGKTTFASKNADNTARKVALQADGKIVIAGYSWPFEGGTSDFLLLRYTTNGELDKSFSGDGVVRTDISGDEDFATALAVQPDGKLIAAGYSFGDVQAVFSLARYNTNGTLDKSFDGDGKLTTSFELDAYGPDIALLSNGKILLAGETYDVFSDASGYALARYNSNGSLDGSFDGDGKKTVEGLGFNPSFSAMALQADGKIIVLGYTLNQSTGFTGIALTRLTTTGELDKTFDDDGTLTSHLLGFSNVPTDLIIKNDKAYIGGYAYTPSQVSLVAVYGLGSSLNKSFVNNHAVQSNGLLENTSSSLAVRAAPNPSTQYFTVSLQGAGNAGVQVKVSDATGRLIESKNNTAPNTVLQIGQAYRPGVYYLEVTQGSRKSVVTLVKQ